jgi:hypothetical protein
MVKLPQKCRKLPQNIENKGVEMEIRLGTKLQNTMYYEIKARVIDLTRDSAKLFVKDYRTNEEGEMWYKLSTIHDYWKEQKEK